MAEAKCPMCGATVQVSEKRKLSEIVTCDQCDAELEIVNLKPIELDLPLDDFDGDDDGNWDDDDDDDDDWDDDDEDFEDEEDDYDD